MLEKGPHKTRPKGLFETTEIATTVVLFRREKVGAWRAGLAGERDTGWGFGLTGVQSQFRPNRGTCTAGLDK